MKRNLLTVLTTLLIGAAIGPLTAPAQGPRGGGTTPIDADATAALLTALAGPDGEYAAHAEYSAILAKFGATVQPFANILLAEKQHIAALQQQCVKFGVPVPPDPYLGKVAAPATLLEAAQAGVFAETLNVAMYGTLLAKVQKYPSLAQVFTNLRAASLNNHLPAFEAAVARLEAAALTTNPASTVVAPAAGGTPDRIRQQLRDGSCRTS